jgi:hypothetical protein
VDLWVGPKTLVDFLRRNVYNDRFAVSPTVAENDPIAAIRKHHISGRLYPELMPAPAG